MCTTATALKIDLKKQFENILQGNVKPRKTEQPSVDLAKSFERRKCNHREAINGIDCIASVVGGKNKHRYIIASQSDETRSRLRSIPGTPLVHLNRTVMVLEPASDATMDVKRQTEEQVLLPKTETGTVVGLKSSENTEQPKKKRRGPKGPNPLSVKKKKVRARPEDTNTDAADGRSQVKAGTKRKLEENEESGPPSKVYSHGENEKEKPARKRRKKLKIQNETAAE